jgi:hypothetical protein
MNCCPSADFEFLPNGLRVTEKELQADGYTLQFFPYRAIQTVRYSYTRGDRGGTISLWVQANGTPGAGGLSYRYLFPCGETGKTMFEQLLALL